MDALFDRFGRKKHKSKYNITSPQARELAQTSPNTATRATSTKKLKNSTSLRQKITIKDSTFEAGSAETRFAQEQVVSLEDVDALFESMLERRGILDQRIKESMRNWTVEKKWLLINQDLQAELLTSGAKNSKLQGSAAERVSTDINRLPKQPGNSHNSIFAPSPLSNAQTRLPAQYPQKSTSSSTKLANVSQPTLSSSIAFTDTATTSSSDISDTLSSHLLSITTSPSTGIIRRSKSTLSPIKTTTHDDYYYDMQQHDQNSPEFFVQKFLDPNLRSVTPKIASNLEISLRTRSVDWVLKFIHIEGFHVLNYALDYLNHQIEDRRDVVLELEVEIVKCIKAIINTNVGGKEAYDHPEYIQTLVLSIDCPQWQTRKMVCELLTFLCYSDSGHEHVIRGFELMQKFKKSLGLFDIWIRIFLRTISDKGSVFISNQIPDAYLIEYALSNMLLVNAITKNPPNVSNRIYLRNQFNAAGLQLIVLPKLESFDYNLLSIQIESFKTDAENDIDGAFGDNMSEYSDLSQPSDIYDRLIENISDSERGTEYFISIMKYMLWIQGDPETKCQFYHMLNIIVQQIVMDRRPHENSDDFASTFGMSVAAVFQNFYDLKRLKGIEKESIDLKEQYNQVSKERDELLSEVHKLRILPSQLEHEAQVQRADNLTKEVESLRDVVQTSKDTIAMLKNRIAVYESNEGLKGASVTLTPIVTELSNAVEHSSPKEEAEHQKMANSLLETNNHTWSGKPKHSRTGSIFRLLGRKKKSSKNTFSANDPNKRSSVHSVGKKSSRSSKSSDRNSLMKSGSYHTTVNDSTLSPPPPPPPPPTPPPTLGGVAAAGVPPPPPPPPPPLPMTLGGTGLALKVSTTVPSPPSELLSTASNLPPLISFPSQTVLNCKSDVKLKNFQWKKIDAKAAEHTIWKLESDDVVRKIEKTLADKGAFEKLESLFPAKVNTFLENKRLRTADTFKKDSSIKFLSADKNKNINIAILPKLRQFDSYREVRHHILAMDDKLCTEVFLTNLVAYVPSQDDNLVKMKKYLDGPEEDCLELDGPEKFTIEMMKCYRYETRVKLMLLRIQFWEKFDQLRNSLSVVLHASNSLKSSEAFKELLLIILMFGNYMNSSSHQGSAFGIHIDSINKLSDTKTSGSSKLTLLHVIIGIVRKEFPSVLSFIEDLKDVTQAARVMVSISDTVRDYTEMRQGLKQLDIELDNYWRNATIDEENADQDRFLEVMQEYQTSAVRRFEELEALYINVDAKWRDVMMYYGESPKITGPGEFFNIFTRFIASWKLAATEEQKFTEQQDLIEKRKKDIEGKRQKSAEMFKEDISSETILREESNSDDRRLMDDLIDKLKSGDPGNKLKQRRVRQRLDKLIDDQRQFKPVSTKRRNKRFSSEHDSLILPRRDSTSSNTSSNLLPSAEALLKSLQDEE